MTNLDSHLFVIWSLVTAICLKIGILFSIFGLVSGMWSDAISNVQGRAEGSSKVKRRAGWDFSISWVSSV